MKLSLVLACTAAAALSAPSLVSAHGYMMLPKAKLASGDPTRFATEVRGTTILQVPTGGSFSSSPQINVESFTKAFKASTFTSLRDLIEKKTNTPACGITPAGGEAQPVPDHVEWSSFTDSHVGPCEVWCDNKRVFQDDNCAGNYKSQPAKLPITQADCANAKELKLYWLALHSQDWQVYINCAPLKGSGGGAGGGSGGNTTPAVTPAPTSAKPTTRPATPATSRPASPATSRPSAGGNNSNNNGGGEVGGDSDADCDDDLPIAGDDDCDEELPVAGDDDCEDDLPIAGDDDCDEELPVAGDDKDEYGGESDNINFDALQRGTKYTPGKAKTN